MNAAKRAEMSRPERSDSARTRSAAPDFAHVVSPQMRKLRCAWMDRRCSLKSDQAEGPWKRMGSFMAGEGYDRVKRKTWAPIVASAG